MKIKLPQQAKGKRLNLTAVKPFLVHTSMGYAAEHYCFQGWELACVICLLFCKPIKNTKIQKQNDTKPLYYKESTWLWKDLWLSN